MIAERTGSEGWGSISQSEAIEALIIEANKHLSDLVEDTSVPFTKTDIFRRHWLDIEDIYRDAGWQVTYDKP